MINIRAFSTSTLRRAAGSNKPNHLESLMEILKQSPSSASASRFDKQLDPKMGISKPNRTTQQKDDQLLAKEDIRRETNSLRYMSIPRTGTLAGRSVRVQGPSHLQVALNQLRQQNMANQVPRTISLQRYHERPGKTKRRLRLEKHHREFDMGIKRLFKLVAEARRKGY